MKVNMYNDGVTLSQFLLLPQTKLTIEMKIRLALTMSVTIPLLINLKY